MTYVIFMLDWGAPRSSSGSCAFNEAASIVGKEIDIIDEKTLRFTEGEVPPPSHAGS